MNKEQQKKSAKALFENGHVEKYSRDFFVEHGRKGGKKSKRWKGKTPEEISEAMRKVSKGEKLSTDAKK